MCAKQAYDSAQHGNDHCGQQSPQTVKPAARDRNGELNGGCKVKKTYKAGLFASALAATALLVGSQAFAHPSVPLRDAAGTIIADQSTPYSPKATCGACHDHGVDYSSDPDGTTSISGPRGSYDGGDGVTEGATKTVIKTQGVMNQTTGEAEWVTFETTAYKHGFVVGRHSQQGRNEDYGNHLRHAVKGKFWANSPGMFGKY